MSRPAENFEYMSSRVVSYAKGIPLALCVVGSNLKGLSLEEWEIELGKYRKVPDAVIQGVLEISYYDLSELEQKIFLDCACFFKGEKWEYVERILKAYDYFPNSQVIASLKSKCLMVVDENGCVEMHNLIQDMGREIVRKESPSNPGNRSRLWSHKDILQVLQENTGSDKIEGIMLHPFAHEVVEQWANTAFEKMKNLKILIVRNATFSTGPSCLPNSLRLLDWLGFPSESFQSEFHPEKIVDFNLSHSPLILPNLKTFEDLTFMNLSQCQSITQIPDLSGAKNLRVLTLDGCRNLEGFHRSFGSYMRKLVYLSATECTMLRSFVPKMYFPSLEVISFNHCSRLEHFPDVIRTMDKPLKIHMVNTAIKEFPESIGKLTGLEYVDMSTCKKLRDLTRSFLLLPKLIVLKVDGCYQLGESFKRFRERHSMENLCSNLKELCFSKANLSYEDLYTILEIFPKLEHLNVSHNAFVSIPESIKESLQLKSLDISFCRNLRVIPHLPSSIQKVDARYCPALFPKSSSMLLSKVCEEKERIQVVVPKTEFPDWFDYVGSEDSPLFWACGNFPVVALAFEFGEVKENNEVKVDTLTSEMLPEIMPNKSYIVGLHLFLDGKEIFRKDYHSCSVGEHHVLMCDLRTLFNDKEWQDLDACVGDDWKAIQVQCESRLIINRSGVYVYKQTTKTVDISFNFPNSTNCYMPSSCLVPKTTPEEKTRNIQNLDLVETFAKYLNTFKSDQSSSVAVKIMRWCRNVKANVRGEHPSALAYDASLMQECEECVWDVTQILEMLMSSVANDILDAKVQRSGLLVVELLTRKAQHVKEKVHEALHINMSIPIILKECKCSSQAPSRRYYGSVELEEGNPLVWRIWKGKEDFRESVSTVLLKCGRCYLEEASSSSNQETMEEGYNYKDHAVKELLRRIEDDASRLNKFQGKWKASIVLVDASVSEKYMMETEIIRGQKIFGRLGSNFNRTTYGNLRTRLDFKRNINVQHGLKMKLNGQSEYSSQNKK